MYDMLSTDAADGDKQTTTMTTYRCPAGLDSRSIDVSCSSAAATTTCCCGDGRRAGDTDVKL